MFISVSLTFVVFLHIIMVIGTVGSKDPFWLLSPGRQQFQDDRVWASAGRVAEN